MIHISAFTKGLACIARYGDDLCLHATPEVLTLCTTNAAKSAYCGTKFLSEFFESYHVGPKGGIDTPPELGEPTVRGQLLVKVSTHNHCPSHQSESHWVNFVNPPT
jgi:cell cycle checkpoint control protein RAD9A